MDQAALMLTLSGRVSQTQQVLATQFSFRLRTPELLIKVTTHSNHHHLLTAHTCMHQQTYACTHTHTRKHTHAQTRIRKHIYTNIHTQICQGEDDFDRNLSFHVNCYFCYFLKIIGTAVVGQTMQAEISFTNPLPHALKAVMLRIEGLGLLSIRKIAVG